LGCCSGHSSSLLVKIRQFEQYLRVFHLEARREAFGHVFDVDLIGPGGERLRAHVVVRSVMKTADLTDALFRMHEEKLVIFRLVDETTSPLGCEERLRDFLTVFLHFVHFLLSVLL